MSALSNLLIPAVLWPAIGFLARVIAADPRFARGVVLLRMTRRVVHPHAAVNAGANGSVRTASSPSVVAGPDNIRREYASCPAVQCGGHAVTAHRHAGRSGGPCPQGGSPRPAMPPTRRCPDPGSMRPR